MDAEDHATPNRDTYPVLDERIEAPPLPGTVIVFDTADDVIDRLAVDLVAHAEQCVRDHGDFHLALSGGRTPEPLYQRLMYDPDFRRLPWRRTHLWIVDERCVPLDDDRSNFKLIRETIVDHADIPPEQVHAVAATQADADAAYEREFKQAMLYRPAGEDRLDYVLLGMGADGHTASLFPCSDALTESHRLVRRVQYDQVDPPDRITLTFNVINAARMVAVLVTGSGKATTIKHVARSNEPVGALPITCVAPHNGLLVWYLDAAAAGQPDKEPPCAQTSRQ